MSQPSSPAPRTPSEHHHILVQAPVPAVDVDGIRVVTVGTALYAVAAVVTGLLHPRLAADGRGWWFAVCVSGFGLGLLGLIYCWNRVRQRRAGSGPTAAGADPVSAEPPS